MTGVRPTKYPSPVRPSHPSSRPSPSSDAIVQSAIAAIESLAIYMAGEREVPLFHAPTVGPSLPLPATMTKPTDIGIAAQISVPTGTMSGANSMALGCGLTSGCHLHPTHSLSTGSASVQVSNNVDACVNGETVGGYAGGMAVSGNAECIAVGVGGAVAPFQDTGGVISNVLGAPSYGEPALGSSDEDGVVEIPAKLAEHAPDDGAEEAPDADEPAQSDE